MRLLLFLFCFIAVTQVFSQTGPNILASENFKRGEALFNRFKYDSAINYFKNALLVYEAAGSGERSAECYNKLAECYIEISKYDLAEECGEKALAISAKLGVNTEIEARACRNLSIVSRMKGKYDNSIEHLQRALAILKGFYGNSDIKVAEILGFIGQAYFYKGDIKLAEKYHLEALEMAKRTVGETHHDVAKILSGMGTLYYGKGDFTKAIEYYQKALKSYKITYGEYHNRVGGTLNNIGVQYVKKGDYTLAMEYFLKALAVYNRTLGKNHTSVASAYNNIGNVYFNQNDFQLALTFYQKALRIDEENYGKKHPRIALAYFNIGLAYDNMNQTTLTLGYYKKALAIWIETLGEDVPEVAGCYQNIAQVHRRNGDSKLFLEFANKSLDIVEKDPGKRNSNLALDYNTLGDFYLDAKDYKRAFAFYHKAMVINLLSPDIHDKDTLPSSIDSFNPNQFLLSLNGTANVLTSNDIQKKNLHSLNTAVHAYRLCDKIIDKARKAHRKHADKIAFQKNTLTVYEGAIETCLKMYEYSKEEAYRDEAFYFLEKSKAGVLTEALEDLSTKSFGLVPEHLLAMERDLKVDVAFYESEIISEKENTSGYDSAKVENYTSKLFDLNRKLDSLAQHLESEYTDYYALKYQQKTIDIDAVKRQVPKSAALISFFEGEQKIYLFAVTSDNYEIFSIPRDSVYDKLIRHFREDIILPKGLNNKPEENYKRFVSSASDLYNLLLKKTLDLYINEGKIKHLVIIPDGQLAYIPFGILLIKRTNSGSGNFTRLHYLIKDYAVSYGYSASLYFRDPIMHSNSKYNYLSFAPYYKNEKPDSLTALSLRQFRDAVTALKWNQEEVKMLSRKIGGDYYIASDATEKRFKEEAPDYAVIHLAMHALIDDENPMNSKLVFSNDNDTTEDGFLHAFELYNMQLNAQMAVLSACNTGYGKLARGEGVMSLARAFTYAGVPSVVMSQWSVDDEATGKLMQFFYENLKLGMNKSDALRAANLSYVQNADPAYTHPFYWAAFVSMGNDSPILNNQSQWNTILICVSVLIVGIVVLVMVRKKMLKH